MNTNWWEQDMIDPFAGVLEDESQQPKADTAPVPSVPLDYSDASSDDEPVVTVDEADDSFTFTVDDPQPEAADGDTATATETVSSTATDAVSGTDTVPVVETPVDLVIAAPVIDTVTEVVLNEDGVNVAVQTADDGVTLLDVAGDTFTYSAVEYHNDFIDGWDVHIIGNNGATDIRVLTDDAEEAVGYYMDGMGVDAISSMAASGIFYFLNHGDINVYNSFEVDTLAGLL